MNTAQEQVTADANALAAAAAAMETAAIDLNAAHVTLQQDLSRKEFAKVGPPLSKAEGVLATAEKLAAAAQAAAVAWVNANPPAVTPPPPPPVVTVPSAPVGLTATAGNGQVALTWGTPTSNGGATILGYEVFGDSAVVIARVMNTAAIVSNLTNGTAYTFQVVALNSAGDSPAATITSTPVAPVTPPSNSPVPMMSQFSSYVPAKNGIFNFASMPSTAAGVIPAGWVLSPSEQIAGGTSAQSLASDVQLINGQGVVLTVSNAHSPWDGGSIQTRGNFTVLGSFYREIEAILPALVDGQTVNQIGLWMLTLSNNGEIDLLITGWGNISGNLETGNQSQYPGHGPNYMVNGAYASGRHKIGASWDNNPAHGVQYYLDGNAVGSAPWPNGHAPDTNSPWFLILTNQGAGPNGPNGAPGKTVYGTAGQVTVVYDYTFVPA